MAGANPYPSPLVTPEVSSPGPRHPGSFQSGASVLRFKVFSGLLTPSSVARTAGEKPLKDCPAPGRRRRVQPGETPLQDCPAPGRRRRVQPGETPLQDCPAPGRRRRVQPGETPLQDCPAPGGRPSLLCPNPSVPSPQSSVLRSGPLISTRIWPLLVASSRCRFYCRFWMPLLVAVWQNKITVRYNTADQLQMSKESGS